MKIDILTIFPGMFKSPFAESMVNRAINHKVVEINLYDLRHWAQDERGTVDDRHYGGGPGMLMLIEPIDRALKDLSQSNNQTIKQSKIILTSARGTPFTQGKAQELSHLDHLILIAGHYEGVDQRVSDHLIDEEISIGDYVLTGGELPTMVLVDAIVRLLPGVVGDPNSLVEESHQNPGILEYPQYSRPEKYGDWSVPSVLISGDHQKIRDWRQSQLIYSNRQK
jgi:tRNA (guanine37-N1)-methyltransferase